MNLAFDQNTLTSSFGPGAFIGAANEASLPTPTTGGLVTITSLDSNTINGSANGDGGLIVDNATFDATPGGAIQAVTGGNTVIGTTVSRVQGDGLDLENVSGTLAFNDLDIANNNGTGLSVENSKANTFTLNIDMGNANNADVNTTNGAAIFLDPLTVNANLNNVTSTNVPAGEDAGVALLGVDGSVTFGTTTVTGSAVDGVLIDGGTGTFTFNGTTTVSNLNNGVGDQAGIFIENGSATVNFVGDVNVSDVDSSTTMTPSAGVFIEQTAGTIQFGTVNINDLGGVDGVGMAFLNTTAGSTTIAALNIGTTTGVSGGGVAAINSDGSITINGGTIQNVGLNTSVVGDGEGIYIENSADAAFNSMNVTGGLNSDAVGVEVSEAGLSSSITALNNIFAGGAGFGSGALFETLGTGILCLNSVGNTATGSGGDDAIELDQMGGSTLGITQSDLTAFAAQNPGTNAANVSVSGMISFNCTP